MYLMTENKRDQSRGGDCIKKLCENFKKHEIEMINNKKKKMASFTPEKDPSHFNKTNCSMCLE